MSPRPHLRWLVGLILLALVASACVEALDENPLAGDVIQGGGDIDSDELDEEIDERIAPDTGLDGRDAPDPESVVEAALLDVEAFWDRNFEDVYGDRYQPISGGFHPYGPRTETPECGPEPLAYEEIAANAFYCPSNDLIAWDAVNLVPDFYEEFGGFSVGIVFAHEFGHAIQARIDLLGAPTILTELQADCFAGAWTADVEDGNSDYFTVGLSDLDKAIAGFLSLRDGVGTSAQDPAAHGTGFDRIGAFSEGYEGGLDACERYPDLFESGALVIVEVPFTSPEDFERGGNLPLEDLMPALIVDLEDFWTVLFDEMGEGTWTPVDDVLPLDPEVDEVTCGGRTFSGEVLVNAAFYCATDNTVYLDAVNLVPRLNEIGDYAVATEVARQYAYAAQARLGTADNSVEANLQADCFTGLYAASGFLNNRPNQELVLSPGDLDEAVIAFLAGSDSGQEVESGDVTVGTAFQRFDAYRSGFMEGLEACEALRR